MSKVSFSSIKGPYQLLPLRDRVNLGARAMKEYSAFPETSSPDCLMSYPRHPLGVSYPSTEMQSEYSTVPVDCARGLFDQFWFNVDLGLMAMKRVNYTLHIFISMT